MPRKAINCLETIAYDHEGTAYTHDSEDMLAAVYEYHSTGDGWTRSMKGIDPRWEAETPRRAAEQLLRISQSAPMAKRV